MKFSFVAVYFTLLVTFGLVGARPVLNLEQRDECGLACQDSQLLSRGSDATDALSARAPASLEPAGPTDLAARFVGAAVKVAKIGAKIGKKIFGGLKKLFRKRKGKKRKAAAKGAANQGNQQHQQRQNNKHKKRDLDLEWEEFVEREEAADIYERSYDFEGDDVYVRGYEEILVDDLE